MAPIKRRERLEVMKLKYRQSSLVSHHQESIQTTDKDCSPWQKIDKNFFSRIVFSPLSVIRITKKRCISKVTSVLGMVAVKTRVVIESFARKAVALCIEPDSSWFSGIFFHLSRQNRLFELECSRHKKQQWRRRRITSTIGLSNKRCLSINLELASISKEISLVHFLADCLIHYPQHPVQVFLPRDKRL